MLQPDQITDTLRAYQLAKRGNSLRVMAEAVRWAKRGARVNTISPGIIMTPLAKDELTGPRGEGYRRMIERVSGRTGRDTGRGRRCRRPSHGSGRSVYHGKRLPDGRWRHGFLLLWRARARAIDLGWHLSDRPRRSTALSWASALECHRTDRQRSVPNGRARIAAVPHVFDFEFASEEVAAIDAPSWRTRRPRARLAPSLLRRRTGVNGLRRRATARARWPWSPLRSRRPGRRAGSGRCGDRASQAGASG